MESPLRILHVVVNMNRGGAETLIMNLYRNIDRTKVQFDFLTCKKGAFDREINQLGGKIYRIPYITDVGHIQFIKELERFFHSNQQYNIIHSHLDKMSGFVLKAAKKANIPIRIAHSHNTESEGNLLAKMYKWYVGSHINLCATHLYACSQKAAIWLFKDQFSKASILANGIEIDRFKFSSTVRKSIRNDLEIKENTFVLGHVGRFSKQKNHLFLLNVFKEINKKIPDSMLVLVGDGSLRQEIEQKINELQLQDRVKLLGIRDDTNRLLQAFDLFVFPSLHEGLPVTLIEAQGAGLPCLISSNITKEVDMNMGLIQYLPIRSEKIWAEYIITTSEKKTMRNIPLQPLVKKGYDIRSVAVKTEETYLALCEGII